MTMSIRQIRRLTGDSGDDGISTLSVRQILDTLGLEEISDIREIFTALQKLVTYIPQNISDDTEYIHILKIGSKAEKVWKKVITECAALSNTDMKTIEEAENRKVDVLSLLKRHTGHDYVVTNISEIGDDIYSISLYLPDLNTFLSYNGATVDGVSTFEATVDDKNMFSDDYEDIPTFLYELYKSVSKVACRQMTEISQELGL